MSVLTPDSVRSSELARIWHTASRTPRRWMESGLITGYRTPGGTWMAHYEPAVAALVAADIKPGERLLSTGEVAALVRVDPATATHWCTSGKLPHATTPGGHRRVAYRHLMEVLEQVA